jgi:hypothetical protein
LSTNYDPPSPTALERADVTGRELLGWVPHVGGGLKALVELAFPPLLGRRRDEWMHRLGAAVERLERQGQLDMSRLAADEGFIDVLLHATIAAMRTRHEEKRQALSSGVVHAAIAVDPDRDEELLFVRYIEELSPSHLQFLRFLGTHETHIADVGSYQELLDAYGLDLVQRHMRPVHPEFFRVMCEDLVGRGLLRISRNVDDFPGLKENDVIVTESPAGPQGTATILVTGIGQRFAQYIEEPAS